MPKTDGLVKCCPAGAVCSSGVVFGSGPDGSKDLHTFPITVRGGMGRRKGRVGGIAKGIPVVFFTRRHGACIVWSIPLCRLPPP